MGPADDDGPFAGQPQGGCGWHRYVFLGVGVGKPVMPNVPAVAPPPEAGVCERCGGVLSRDGVFELINEDGAAPLAGEPVLQIPGKRTAQKMIHAGELYAQLHEPDADSILDPGER